MFILVAPALLIPVAGTTSDEFLLKSRILSLHSTVGSETVSSQTHPGITSEGKVMYQSNIKTLAPLIVSNRLAQDFLYRRIIFDSLNHKRAQQHQGKYVIMVEI